MDTYFPWIAVVDDEEPVRRAVMRLLRAEGLAAREFASGVEFLAALEQELPCCAIVDLHMPQMGGLEVQARLAELAPQLPLVIVTGQHTPELEQRVRRHPVQAYLHKPMNDNLLLEAVLPLCKGDHHA